MEDKKAEHEVTVVPDEPGKSDTLAAGSAVVMNESAYTRLSRRFGRRQIAVYFLLVLFLAAGGLGYYAWQQKKDDNKKTGSTSEVQPQLTGAALSDAVNIKLGTKDYNGAISLLKEQKQQTGLDTQLLLVSAYTADGDYKNALAIYDSLDKAGKLSGVNTVGAAQVAEQAADYKTAVRYYTSAKSRIQAEKSHTAEDLIRLCDAKIAELEGKL